MARRPMGIAGIQKKDELNRALRKQGDVLNEAKLEHLQKSLETFRGHLEIFARKHKDAIRADPKFRAQFGEMCNKLGVDPLASNKGFWAELLGVGDHYFDLGVKVITIAIATRPINGGIMGIGELLNRMEDHQKRASQAVRKIGKSSVLNEEKIKITEADIAKAVDKVSVLGSGLKLTTIGNQKALLSVPLEMSHDQSFVLDFASSLKGSPISAKLISERFGWDKQRAKTALLELAAEVFAWWDAETDDYWFPAFIEGGVRFEI